MAKKLSYSGAREIRQSGLSNQITERLLSGESVSSSFSQSISESMMANVAGIKEKFDPLNIAKVLTGGSVLGPALLGRMMGRSSEDIGHFSTGKAKQKKDPLFLGTVKRYQENIKVNDTFADALGKLYTLFKTIDDHEKLSAQLRKDFAQERAEEEQRRNEEVLRQIKKVAMKAKRINDKAKKEKSEEKPKEEGPTITQKVTETASRIPAMVKGAVGALGVGVAGYGLSKLLKKGEAATYNTILGGKEIPLDTMTINEVLQYQSTMKGGTAVGKYQMIKSTLIEAKNKLNLTGNEKFDQQTQDMIYNQYLVGSKRPQLRDYISGKSDDINAAALEMAKEFASFPVTQRVNRPASDNWPAATIEPGESYYKGVGRNPTKASISVEQVLSGLQEERQIRTGQKTIDETGTKVASTNIVNNTTQNSVLANTVKNNIVNNTTQNTTVDNTTQNNIIKNAENTSTINNTKQSSTITPTSSATKVNQIQSTRTTQGITGMWSMETPKREVGTYMNNISSENTDIRKEMNSNYSMASIGNNINFTYKPGDSIVYNMEKTGSDLPSVLRD